jgi:hypothetical protein
VADAVAGTRAPPEQIVHIRRRKLIAGGIEIPSALALRGARQRWGKPQNGGNGGIASLQLVRDKLRKIRVIVNMFDDDERA